MNIWIPKVKTLDVQDPVCTRIGLAGYFGLHACNRYGQPRRSLYWKQLVTDYGLNEFASSGGLYWHDASSYLQVGTGTTTPSFSDTTLATYLAGSQNSYASANYAALGSPTYGVTHTLYKQFSLGAINATLTEVGIGVSSSGSVCFRDLIRDGGGNPTSFPVTSSDQLRVTHTLVMYPPLGTDGTGSFSITGSGSHNYTVRAARVSNFDPSNGYGWATVGVRGLRTTLSGLSAFATQTLGAETSSPTGTEYTGSGAPSWGSYTNGNFYQDATYTLGLSQYNIVGGIGSVVLNLSGTSASNGGLFQMAFSPTIDKYAGSVQRILTLPFRFSWARV